MGKVTPVKSFTDELASSLRRDLSSLGVRARVVIEPVPTTKLVRVYVVTRQRDQLEPSEWVRLLEGIFERQFDPKDRLRVSAFYTLTPEEHRKYRRSA